MKTHILRLLILIGLGLGMLLMPFGHAVAGTHHMEETADNGRIVITGSTELVERTKPVPEFHAVAASRGVDVIIGGSSDQLVIEANDNLIDYVIAEVNEGRLTLSIDNRVNVRRNLHVIVKIPSNGKIDAIEASSAASVSTKKALQADKLDIQLSSAATLDAALKANNCTIYLSSAADMKTVADFENCRIHLSSASRLSADLKADKLTMELSSASDAVLSGTCRTLTVAASSSGDLDAKQLEVQTANVQAASASSVTVNCSGSLVAGASSSAKIRYTGDCHADTHQSSGGSVKKR